MKKVLLFLLVLTLAFSLVGCSKGEKTDSPQGIEDQNTPENAIRTAYTLSLAQDEEKIESFYIATIDEIYLQSILEFFSHIEKVDNYKFNIYGDAEKESFVVTTLIYDAYFKDIEEPATFIDGYIMVKEDGKWFIHNGEWSSDQQLALEDVMKNPGFIQQQDEVVMKAAEFFTNHPEIKEMIEN